MSSNTIDNIDRDQCCGAASGSEEMISSKEECTSCEQRQNDVDDITEGIKSVAIL